MTRVCQIELERNSQPVLLFPDHSLSFNPAVFRAYFTVIKWGRYKAICGNTVRITVVSSIRKKKGRA